MQDHVKKFYITFYQLISEHAAALLQEGGIKSRDIMLLSFVELCVLMQVSTLYYALQHNHTMKFCTITGGYFDFLVLSVEMPFILYGKTPKSAGVTSHSIGKISGSRQI